MLEYENGKSRFSHKRQALSDYIITNKSYYAGIERGDEAQKIAEGIMATGVKGMDTFHIACAILAREGMLKEFSEVKERGDSHV